MRAAIAICLAGGCSFVHGAGGDDMGGDAPPDASQSQQRPPCALGDSSVQLCLDFEQPDLGLDSSAGHHDATVVAATAMPRLSQLAAMLGSGASIHVPETSALDIANNITYEAWLAPSQLPGSDIGVIDNSGQYAIWMLRDGHVGCDLAGHYADSKNPLPLGQFTHVGCTYDGTRIVIYIQGAISGCYTTSSPIATNGSSGTMIGGNFVGGVDNVHVMSRAVTSTEMCLHAGHSNGGDCGGDCGGSS
jgi:hypothetical protein